MKSLSSGQHFPKSMGFSRARNSHVNSRKWVKIKLVRNCMPVLVICKFDEDSIKIENGSPYRPDNIFFIICLCEAKGQVTFM